MKKSAFFIAMVMFLCIESIQSQTEKNRLIYGGAAYAHVNGLSSPQVNFGIQPQFGGFPVKNFALLGLLHFSLGHTDITPYYFGINAGAGPELRYYIGSEKVKFYFHGNVIPHLAYFGHSRFAIRGGAGPAIAFFPHSNLSINIALFAGAYRMFGNANGQMVFSMNVVMNGLFTKKTKNKAEK